MQNVKTFKDVKGCDDAKQELEEVVEYLRNPAKFTRLGGKLPKVYRSYWSFVFNLVIAFVHISFYFTCSGTQLLVTRSLFSPLFRN